MPDRRPEVPAAPARAPATPAPESTPSPAHREDPLGRRLAEVGRAFGLSGDFQGGGPLGNGHIHDTYLAHYLEDESPVVYVHQRINRGIFQNADQLMENVTRVTEHLREDLRRRNFDQLERRALRVVGREDGRTWFEDRDHQAWRTYRHIPRTVTHQVVRRPDQAYRAARAFAEFVDRLRDLPGPRLHDTIPAFHDTPARVRALRTAAEVDAVGRVPSVREEIRFVLDRSALADVLPRLQRTGVLRERVIHNDTKLNNVLFDAGNDEALCVVDLDTVMPGLVPFDFGDLVRTAAITCAEDSQDLEQVDVDREHFRALAEGYQDGGSFLTPTERELLAFSGKLLAYETGVRFLTDHLEGDHYFKIHRPDHNLHRARVQFRLVERIEAQEAELERIVGRGSPVNSLHRARGA